MRKLFSLLLFLIFCVSMVWGQTSTILYDGILDGDAVYIWDWGFSETPYEVDNMGYSEGTKALKWTGYNGTEGYQGIFFGLNTPVDLLANWDLAYVEFKIRAPKGLAADSPLMNVVLYDSRSDDWNYTKYYEISDFQSLEDSVWHTYSIKLTDMLNYSDEINKSEIYAVSFEYFDTGLDEELYIDEVTLETVSPIEETPNMVFVNGKLKSEMYLWPWGFTSDPTEVSDIGYSPGTSAIKWNTYDGSGSQGLFIGLSDNVGHDLSTIWDTDSAYFKLRMPNGQEVTDTLDLYIYDSRNGDWEYSIYKRIENFHVLSDGEWHQFSIALADMIQFNEANETDKTDITAISFETVSGISSDLLIDKVWIGNPNIGITMTMYNGRSLPAGIEFESWGFNNNDFEVAQNEGYTSETPAILWETANWDWQGKGFIFNVHDFTFGMLTDTLKIKIKAPAGIHDLALDFYDIHYNDTYATARKVLNDVDWDGTWKILEIPLNSFDVPENFDLKNVYEFGVVAADTTIPERILLDDIWIGNPEIENDFNPPEPPASLTITTDESFPYINYILWNDVEGENGEYYTLYVSPEPITNLEDENVTILQDNIAEETNIIAHHIFHPVTNGEVTFYYAMICTDASNNISETFTTSGPFTNLAKKRAIVNFGTPPNLELDGYFDEYESAPFNIKPEESLVVSGTIDDSVDFNAKCYMAIDNENLYIGFDVVDDIFSWNAANTVNWWDDESIEFFIGLYEINSFVSHHNVYQRFAEPDYRIVFTPEVLYVDAWPAVDSLMAGSENYYFESGGGSDYYCEAKIPLSFMESVNGDSAFTPVQGMKVPLEIQVNDADVANGGAVARMQLGTNSNEDPWNSNHPYAWTFTWLGMPATDISEELAPVAFEYSLEKNYPNPFNPTTTIDYTIAENNEVSLFIYNALGQKVKTLVNKSQSAGKYSVKFDASNLASGLYFYQIKSGNFTKVHKMLLIK